MAETNRYYAVAFSDVHIGQWDGGKSKRAFENFVEGFLKKDIRINHLIILGDFLDLWRRDDDELLKENMKLLMELVKLKKAGRIGTLQYVVGNHDYVIQWYKWKGYAVRKDSRERREILNEFEFTDASSAKGKVESLILPKKGDNVKFEKTFEFRHGHQDGPGQLGRIYDEVCIWLCHQGNTSGWITSKIWKYKAYLPAIASIVLLGFAALQFYYGQVLWSAVFAIATVVSILGFIWMIRKEELKLKKLPQETQAKIVTHQTKKSVKDRGEYEEELWELLPEPLKTKIHARMKDIKPRKVPLDEETNLVVGHTHEPMESPPIWNLGSWVEGDDYPYLTIDHEGNTKLHRWSYREKKLGTD